MNDEWKTTGHRVGEALHTIASVVFWLAIVVAMAAVAITVLRGLWLLVVYIWS